MEGVSEGRSAPYMIKSWRYYSVMFTLLLGLGLFYFFLANPSKPVLGVSKPTFYHDVEHNASCWMWQNSISCLPDVHLNYDNVSERLYSGH